MLVPLVSACSSDDDDTVEEWTLPDDNNSSVYVEFDAKVSDMAGSASTLDKFQVYGFNCALGYSVFGNTRSKDAQGTEVTRNRDDESMWDYLDPKTKAMLKWATLLKYPISFYGISGPGADMVTIGSKGSLPTLKVEMPMDKEGNVDGNKTNDLLFARALRLDPRHYLNDTTKVELQFEHILPMVQVRASLANAGDLEVTVKEVTLMGMAAASEFNFNEFSPVWTAYAPKDMPATADVALSLQKPVALTVSPADMQDRGAYVVPQTVKPWTSYIFKDGAGIRLTATVRSKANHAYLVGAEGEWGEVYVPMDDMTLVSGNVFTFNVTFNTIYNADGTLGYRAVYHPIVTPWNYKDDNLILQ